MGWAIEIADNAKKILAGLDKPVQKRIHRFLRERLSTISDPRSIGEALHGPVLGRYWKYRVGDYRLICDIQDETVKVLVVKIGHRRQVYS